jgi:hypothetical protein
MHIHYIIITFGNHDETARLQFLKSQQRQSPLQTALAPAALFYLVVILLGTLSRYLVPRQHLLRFSDGSYGRGPPATGGVVIIILYD